METAVKRPRPDLQTLAERCPPARESPDAIEAFYDILKLREQPDPQAVPALERVLADHQGSNRIHRFAAAQALHAIGTPQAQQVLARYLLSPAYPAFHGIRYAFFHGMSPGLRDDFIERYHLRNLAEDVSLGLAITTRADSSPLFTVTATNTSANALRLLDPGHPLETMLCLRSEEGVFVPAERLARKEFEHPTAGWGWIHLEPGARHEWRIELDGKAVALEPASGYSFDSPMLPRPR